MNRSLFCTLVLLFCIALVVGMAACERKSGRRVGDVTVTTSSQVKPVKIVIGKFIKVTRVGINEPDTKLFKVTTVPSDGLSHYIATKMYVETGDTIMALPKIDFY